MFEPVLTTYSVDQLIVNVPMPGWRRGRVEVGWGFFSFSFLRKMFLWESSIYPALVVACLNKKETWRFQKKGKNDLFTSGELEVIGICKVAHPTITKDTFSLQYRNNYQPIHHTRTQANSMKLVAISFFFLSDLTFSLNEVEWKKNCSTASQR